jgi:hypothetical protein
LGTRQSSDRHQFLCAYRVQVGLTASADGSTEAFAFSLSVASFFFSLVAGGFSGDVVVVLLAATILLHLLAWILNRSEHDFRVVFAIGSSSLAVIFVSN